MFRRVSTPLASKPPTTSRTTRGVHFTLVGVTYVGISLLVGLAALKSQANLLYLMFGLAMGGLLISGVLSSRVSRAARVLDRQVPEQVVAGRPFTIRYLLQNRRTWGPAYSLHLQEMASLPHLAATPEAYVPSIPPASTVEIDVPALAVRRGQPRLGPVRLATRFPLRLLTRYRTGMFPQEIVVLPALGRLHRDLLAEVSEGVVRRRRRRMWLSSADEYSGVREYRPGDNPRLIHWRQSARTGQLIVRETTRHRPDRLMLVLDLSCDRDDRQGLERREAIISCAATLGCEALERGFHVGLIANVQPLVALAPAGGLQHRPRLLSALARLPDEPVIALSSALRRTRWPVAWRGRCVLLAVSPSQSLHNSIRYLAERAGKTISMVASDPKFAEWFEPPAVLRPTTGKNQVNP